jgi:hypothetical protein
MNIIRTETGIGYEFKNPDSKKPLIILEGSGWTSVLGLKKSTNWKYAGLAAQMIPLLNDTYTIFVPEKFDWEPGRIYDKDVNERARCCAL